MKIAGDLNILMIGLSTDMVTQPLGDSVERHVEYARHINHLHIIVYAPHEVGDEPVKASDHLTIYPSKSRSRYLFPLDACRIGAQICRSQPINLIQTQDPFTTGLAGTWLKRHFGLPLQINNHASFFGNPYWIAERPLRHRVFNRLGKWVAGQADTLRTVNDDQRQRYLQMGIDSQRIKTIHTPVNVERFVQSPSDRQVTALREELSLPADGQVVLWVGRPEARRQKRLHDLLDAFSLVRRGQSKAFLVLVGDMAGAHYVSQHIAALGLEAGVICPGPVAHADLPTYYALSDVFALSSAYEGMPKVLAEAALSGRPVVATNIAGVGGDAVVAGETGLLCKVANPADMAEKLELLLADPQRASEMGQRGRELAQQKFDRERSIQAIVALWQRGATCG